MVCDWHLNRCSRLLAVSPDIFKTVEFNVIAVERADAIYKQVDPSMSNVKFKHMSALVLILETRQV